MGRTPKCRRVGALPKTTYFKPDGIPLRLLCEVRLTIEEAEAIRLKDLEGLEQAECAAQMSVSRATFQRILASGRHKVADALLNGKAIKIEGGNFEMAIRRFRCQSGHELEVTFETLTSRKTVECPICHTFEVEPVCPTSNCDFE